MGWKDAPIVAEAAEPKWAKAPEVKPAGYDKVAASGVQSGIAGLAGLPVDTAENLINLALAGYGAIRAAGGNPEAAPNLLERSVGGSEWMRDRLRSIGVSVDNPNPQDPVSRGVHTGGMVLGSGGRRAVLPAVAAGTAQETLGPEWAAAASMIPGAVPRAANAVREPSMKAKQAFNQVRDPALREAQEAGYVVPPSQVRQTFAGNRLESVAGKAALNQEAILRNQAVTDGLARKAIGLPENAPLTEGALQKHREQLAEPYREVAGLSPVAKKALEKLGDARAEAKAHWRHYDMQGVPESRRQAKQYDQRAEMLERVIEREAMRARKPDLVKQLKDARVTIAKTWDVERALNLGDGHVDAKAIARAYDRGRPLSDELQTIAKFSANFPQLTRSSAGTPTPGVSALEPIAVAGLAMGGQATGMGWLPAGLPLAAGPARSLLLSDMYQRRFAQPSYAPFGTESDAAYLLRPSVLLNSER